MAYNQIFSGELMVWAPHVTVAAVIERDHKFLMVEERSHEKKPILNQPAGHLEYGESLVEAVVRETMEETCWGFEPISLIGIYRWINPDSGVTYLRFVFTGNLLGFDSQATRDKDIYDIHWMSKQELMNRQQQWRSPQVMKAIDDYLRQVRFPVNILKDF